MFLALYPVVELSRCIIQYNIIGSFEFTILPFQLELGLIWGFYLVIPFIMNIALKLAYYTGNKKEVSVDDKVSRVS